MQVIVELSLEIGIFAPVEQLAKAGEETTGPPVRTLQRFSPVFASSP